MLDGLGLHESIFWLPDSITQSLSAAPQARASGLYAAKILDSLLSQSSTTTSSKTATDLILPPIHTSLLTHAALIDVRPRLYLASMLTPFAGLSFPEKKKTISAVEGIIREGLKVNLLPSDPTP